MTIPNLLATRDYVDTALVGVGGGGWTTREEIDFAALASQTFASNGAITIDGKSAIKINSANESVSAAIVAGTGLVFQPTGSSDYNGATRTLPGIWIPASQLYANWDRATPMRIWLRFTSNVAANYDSVVLGFDDNNANSTGMIAKFGYAVAGQGQSVFVQNAGTNTGFVDTLFALAGYDVMMIEIPSPATGEIRSYYGTWSGGWPAIEDMLVTKTSLQTGGTFGSDAFNVAAGVLLGAQRASSGTALTVTMKNLRFDTGPSTSGGGATHYYGAYASRPAAGNAGRMAYYSDRGVPQFDTGTAWENMLPGGLYPEPTGTGLTWFNQGGASSTFDKGRLLLTPDAVSINHKGLVRPIVTLAGSRVFAGFDIRWANSVFYGFGVTMRESGTGRAVSIHLATNNSGTNILSAARWNNDTSRASFTDYLALYQYISPNSAPLLLGAWDAGGGSYAVGTSVDGGKTYQTAVTYASPFATAPDQFGISMLVSAVSGSPFSASCFTYGFVGA